VWWLTSLFTLFACWIGPVSAACSVNVIPVVFGTYEPNVSSPIDATGAVNVTCDKKLAYLVRLDAGANSKGAFTQRAMLDPIKGGLIHYNLYFDPALTQIFGDGTSGTVTASGNSAGTNQQIHVYGRIPARQNVSVGSYSDSVTVIVEW